MDLPKEKKNICDVCGDIGVDSAILTCAQCKINSEHMYCMRVVLEEAIDDWVCEECASVLNPEPQASFDPVEVGKSGALPAQKSKLQNESRVGSGSGNWEKRVEKGKTKYLPVLEAIKLSSGDINSSAPVRANWRSHSKGPKFGMDVNERSAIRSKTAPMSFSSQQDLASGSSQQPKLSRPGNMEISKKPVQHNTKLTEVPRQVNSPHQSSKYLDIQKELQKQTQWAQTKVRRPVKKPLATPSLDAPPVSISGGNIHSTNELRISSDDNTNTIVLQEFDKSSQIPAVDAVWKGIFRIHDDHRQEELNPQIQAHPPSRVLKKIHEFSKKMPGELHFQLVCAKTFLNNLFNEETPDERDVALYFFPSVGERSKDYICLLESINLRDLALRLQIGDVELLVFTSKLLPANYQRWDGHYFLWGVFHRVKNITTACSVERVLDQSVIPSDEAIHGDNQEEVEMEIDMIGGTEVGRIDVRVAKQPPMGTSTSIKGESTASPALPTPNQQTSGLPKPVSAKVKTEVQDIPPGFEEEYRRRLQGS